MKTIRRVYAKTFNVQVFVKMSKTGLLLRSSSFCSRFFEFHKRSAGREIGELVSQSLL